MTHNCLKSTVRLPVVKRIHPVMLCLIQLFITISCFLAFTSADFDVGDAPIKRPYLKTEKGKIFLTNSAHPVAREGHCTTFTYYCIKSDSWGNAAFMVFRPVDNNGTFESQHYSRISNFMRRKDGVYTHTIKKWKRYVNVRKGDMLAIYISHHGDEANIVPYDAEECAEGEVPTLVFDIPKRAYRNHTFHDIPAGSKPCRKFSMQLHCKDGSAIGPLPLDRAELDSSISRMYVMNSNIPWSGKLTSWELYAKRTGEIHLQVFRENDTRGNSTRRFYKLIASKPFNITKLQLNTLKLDASDQVEIQKGDRLGFYYSNGNPIPYDKTNLCHTQSNHFPIAGNSEMWYVDNPRKLRVGKTYRMKKLTEGLEWPECRSYSLKGIILTE